MKMKNIISSIKNRTLVMGILNLTPDSFFDGQNDLKQIDIRKKIINMKNAGVDIIDVGGESSRPGAEPIPPKVEMERIKPVFPILKEFPDTLFSIDTYKPDIAEIAIKNGFKIINDITGGGKDGKIFQVANKYDIPIIIMHMEGNPKTMQSNPHFDNVIDSIITFFKKRIKVAKQFGLKDDQIILDPGIGFGKRIEDNFQIIHNLNYLTSLGYPILIGTSRKSFLQINYDNPQDRLPATLASLTFAIQNGANILRVHDVKEAVKCVKFTDRYLKENSLRFI